MKNTIKISSIILMMSVLVLVPIQGQSVIDQLLGRTTFSMLQGKWEYQDSGKPTDWSAVETYNATTCIVDFRAAGESTSLTRSYYLSNSVETIFNNSKIGNTRSGKFRLIIKQEKDGEVSFFQIKEITTTTLVLKNLKNSYVLTYKKR